MVVSVKCNTGNREAQSTGIGYTPILPPLHLSLSKKQN
jgi:hypothetical protein